MRTEILEYRWQEDEVCDIYFKGEHIYHMNHDLHGWDGMDGIRNALNAVAKAAGFRIVSV